MHERLKAMLAPRSVAVVGASPKPGSVAGEILRNLQRCGFSGRILPVNPKYDRVDGFTCHPSVAELPEAVDLAILAVNRHLVLDVVRECGERGIENLVIITAGFKESGERGAVLERELRGLIQKYDLKVVGPNCMGIIHSVPDVQLNASFSRWFPRGGEIAFISQSGSLGETLLECFEDAGLGVSLFVNLGNRAGLSENDFLAYLEAEERCSAVFLYLESFAEPTVFRALVERIAQTKPVVILKAGRTQAGAAAVASHTGSLASPDAVVDAFLRQCGALRVNTIQETMTALRALERGVLPQGSQVAILTNAGGAGIIAADACERAGLTVPTLEAKVRAELASLLPSEAGTGNPIDMIATAGAKEYQESLRICLAHADAAVVIFRPPLVLVDAPEDVARGLIDVAGEFPEKPVLLSTLSEEVTPVVQMFRDAKLPAYAMPETAVDALTVLVRARETQRSRDDAALPCVYDRDAALEVLSTSRRERRTGLYFEEGAAILSAYGIPACAHRYVVADRVSSAVFELGFPLVVKIDAPELFHRFEQGAVVTGISNERDLEAAVSRLRQTADRLGLKRARILVQEMLTGRELIYGMGRDSAFGPVVMFGLGGTLVEALGDVSFGVAPVRPLQAQRMIRSIRAHRLLGAFRGQAALDLPSLARPLVALGQMAIDFAELAEIDLNPVIADERNLAAVDILIRLRETPTAIRDTSG